MVTAFAIPFAYRAMRYVTEEGKAGGFAEMAELSLYFGMLVFSFLLRRTDPRRIAGRAACLRLFRAPDVGVI